MKTSLEKIINRIAGKSQLVIGYDLSFLDQAKQLNKFDDIHYMHKGIVQIESGFKIDTFGLKNMIADIEFEVLDIGSVVQVSGCILFHQIKRQVILCIDCFGKTPLTAHLRE